MQVISYATVAQGRAPVTMLIGKLPDQAALAGVLNLVYSLGLPLLDVSCLGEAISSELPARSQREGKVAALVGGSGENL